MSNENTAIGKGNHTNTPNMHQTGITMHSTNTKGLRSAFMHDASPGQFAESILRSSVSPYQQRRLENEVQMDDSLNDRVVSPQRNYEDIPEFRTPNTNNRGRGFPQVSSFMII
jgi:hypothetical protein